MKISVITIVYNDVSHIVQTMHSVLQQTARDSIDYIIIDGASDDGTSELIRSCEMQPDVYVREKDKGIYNAMNKGLRYASGDFVIYINSGDSFVAHNVVERVIHSISECERIPIIAYGDYREKHGVHYGQPIPSRKYNKIWYGPVASHQSTFYNLHFLRSNELSYDENYKVAADYKLTLEVIKMANENVLQMPFCISNFDVQGVSSKNQNMGLFEANRARREILGWGWIREYLLTLLLLGARIMRHHGKGLYSFLRRL